MKRNILLFGFSLLLTAFVFSTNYAKEKKDLKVLTVTNAQAMPNPNQFPVPLLCTGNQSYFTFCIVGGIGCIATSCPGGGEN